MKGRNILSLEDLSPTEIEAVLNKATELKRKLERGEPHEFLHGKTLGMIFAKPSTRTRASFETAMTQLGGHAIYFGWNELQLGRGETIADTARTLSRYVDGIVARLFDHRDLRELARNSNVPVINGLTDLVHPCQVLSDLFTIREKKGKLKGLKLAYVGDGNNVCHSLLLGCTKIGMNISVATPKGYQPRSEIVALAEGYSRKSGAEMFMTNDPSKAVADADVVYTDVWVSMGMEKERKRRLKAFRGYQINASLLRKAKDDAIFMHCLPAHRGEEVTDEVIDGPQSVVFDQAENRLHVQKAILCLVM
jgi:ornithine carbamoyltransferase